MVEIANAACALANKTKNNSSFETQPVIWMNVIFMTASQAFGRRCTAFSSEEKESSF